jgi:hypothetical protein
MKLTGDHTAEPAKRRTFGFRFSNTDWAVIAITLAAALGFQRIENPLSWMVLIAVGHFFLFCNVFRVRRRFEIAWACAFIINIACWLSFSELAWASVLACQIPVTLCFLLMELRSPHYHGVFARQINPHLQRYLQGEAKH